MPSRRISSATLKARAGRLLTSRICEADLLIIMLTTRRRKSFWEKTSPEIILYIRQLYTNAMFIAFMISGQYHFLPRITGLRSDKARSSRSTPPIPRLYAAITAGSVMFPLPFPLIHLLAFPTGSTPYALLPMVVIIPPHNFQVARAPEIVRPPFPFLHITNICQWAFSNPIVSHGTGGSETFHIQVNKQLIT